MIYEATRTFAVKKVSVQTPLAPCPGFQHLSPCCAPVWECWMRFSNSSRTPASASSV
jgi:hypothetical protein